MIKKIFFVVVILLLSQFAFALEPNLVLVNSEDWRDVYSAMLYGKLAAVPAKFLVSDRHGKIVLSTITKDSRVWMINSKTVPFIYGYGSLVEGKVSQ